MTAKPEKGQRKQGISATKKATNAAGLTPVLSSLSSSRWLKCDLNGRHNLESGVRTSVGRTIQEGENSCFCEPTKTEKTAQP